MILDFPIFAMTDFEVKLQCLEEISLLTICAGGYGGKQSLVYSPATCTTSEPVARPAAWDPRKWRRAISSATCFPLICIFNQPISSMLFTTSNKSTVVIKQRNKMLNIKWVTRRMSLTKVAHAGFYFAKSVFLLVCLAEGVPHRK